MTKVKKVKKPKARKATKKPLAKVRKIDAKLKPTPEPIIQKIDKKLNTPLKIVNEPRSMLPQNQIPLRMFSGQDTGAIMLSKQFDVLSSKEQKTNEELQNLKNELANEKEDRVNAEDYGAISSFAHDIGNLKINFDKDKYDDLKLYINDMLSGKLSDINRDLLNSIKNDLQQVKNKHDISMAEASMPADVYEKYNGIFKERKTSSLFDDKIVNGDLVDEAVAEKARIRTTKINLMDDVIYNNDLMDESKIADDVMENEYGSYWRDLLP